MPSRVADPKVCREQQNFKIQKYWHNFYTIGAFSSGEKKEKYKKEKRTYIKYETRMTEILKNWFNFKNPLKQV